MHELSITASVVETITERMGEAKVVRVALEIGKLSGVVVDSVRFCFDLVTAGTTVQGARLEVIEIPGLARCSRCDCEVDMPNLLAICPCGEIELEVLSGEELRIKEVEVA